MSDELNPSYLHNSASKGANLLHRDGVNIHSPPFSLGSSDLEGAPIIFLELGRFSHNRLYILTIFTYKFKVYHYKMDKMKKKNIIISKV